MTPCLKAWIPLYFNISCRFSAYCYRKERVMPLCRSPKRIPPNLAQALSQNDSPPEGGFSGCQPKVVLKSKVCKPIMDFREISVILISNLTSPSVNFFQYTSRSKIFLLYAPKNVVRENFHFGSGSKKFPNQNEKIPVPVFSKTQTKISRITVRKIRSGK